MPEITIYDASTGLLTVREMTQEEHANYLEAIKDMAPLSPEVDS